MPQAKIHDIIIIGAGPSGLFCAFQASMLGLSVLIIDSLPEAGGQCKALYPDKPIYDIPGFSQVSGGGLVDNLLAQIAPFAVPILTDTRICKITSTTPSNSNLAGWELQDDRGNSFACQSIIIAAGGGTFSPNRPPLDGIEAFEGKSIVYSIQNIAAFKGSNVVIAGGGDSAVDWAILLSTVAAKVFVVHRRPKFRALPASVSQMEQIAREQPERLELVVPYQLDGIIGSAPQLQGVRLRHLDGTSREIAADFLIPLFGLAMDNKPLHSMANLAWTTDNRHIAVDPATMQTSLPGIFAIGDICSYPGKLKLILTGFAEAALACHSAYSVVHPDKPLHFEYSTSKGVPATPAASAV